MGSHAGSDGSSRWDWAQSFHDEVADAKTDRFTRRQVLVGAGSCFLLAACGAAPLAGGAAPAASAIGSGVAATTSTLEYLIQILGAAAAVTTIAEYLESHLPSDRMKRRVVSRVDEMARGGFRFEHASPVIYFPEARGKVFLTLNSDERNVASLCVAQFRGGRFKGYIESYGIWALASSIAVRLEASEDPGAIRNALVPKGSIATVAADGSRSRSGRLAESGAFITYQSHDGLVRISRRRDGTIRIRTCDGVRSDFHVPANPEWAA